MLQVGAPGFDRLPFDGTSLVFRRGKMGKLIVIEGTDGAGKSTQAPMAAEKMRRNNKNKEVCEVSFPRYDTPTGAVISEYLAGGYGDFGRDSAYGISAVYAFDRLASFKNDPWGRVYKSGGTVLATRYTTSNMIYQTAKLEKSEWGEYIDWLCEFEYEKLSLPKPDMTVLLDMPCDVAQRLMSRRYGGDEGKKDIHERNTAYLQLCRETALFAAERCGFIIIPCSENGEARSIQDIHRDIMAVISKE